MDRIKKEMTKKCRFIRPSELNAHSLSAVDRSKNLLGIISRMWATFNFCLKFIALTQPIIAVVISVLFQISSSDSFGDITLTKVSFLKNC